MLIGSTFNVTAEDDEYNQRKYTFTRYSPEINDSSRIYFNVDVLIILINTIPITFFISIMPHMKLLKPIILLIVILR